MRKHTIGVITAISVLKSYLSLRDMKVYCPHRESHELRCLQSRTFPLQTAIAAGYSAHPKVISPILDRPVASPAASAIKRNKQDGPDENQADADGPHGGHGRALPLPRLLRLPAYINIERVPADPQEVTTYRRHRHSRPGGSLLIRRRETPSKLLQLDDKDLRSPMNAAFMRVAVSSWLFVAMTMSTLAKESDKKQGRDLLALLDLSPTACEFPCCTADLDCGGDGCVCDTSFSGANDGEGHCVCPMAPLEPDEPACVFPCCTTDSDCGPGGSDCFCDTSYPGSNDGEGHCACPMALPEPTGSPTEFNPDLQCMDLSNPNKTAVELVEETFIDPTNADFVEFRNIQASGHACLQYFSQGHAAGKNKVSGEYLLPE
ncbi:hypothetical protein THAOC_12529, partial [Thalassiosira oceanica]